MYDPFAQPSAPGTVQTMTAPSGALSPNNALAPTMMPPTMQPKADNAGHMGPGGVMRVPGSPLMQDPGVQAVWGQRPDHNAFHLALQNAPDVAARTQLTKDWNDQLNQWNTNFHAARQQYQMQQQPNWRPGNLITPTPMSSQFAPQLPVDPPMMTPGGGGTGAPLQGAGGQAPGVMPINPTGQFPLNPSPPSNDWRTMRAPKPNYGA